MARPSRSRQPIYPSFSLVIFRHWAFVRFPTFRVIRGPLPEYQPYARPVEEADGLVLVADENYDTPIQETKTFRPPQVGLKPLPDSASEISVLDLNANNSGQEEI